MNEEVVFARKKGKKEKRDFTAMHVIMLILLIIYTILLFFLLLWGILTAFKTAHEWEGGWDNGRPANYAGFPHHWIDDETGLPVFISNMQKVLRHSKSTLSDGSEVGIGTMAVNSILYSLGCAFTNTLVPFVTAYACAKYKNPVSKIMVAVALAVMAIPIVGAEPAALTLAYRLNLYNHIWGQWVMKANYLGVYFLVFYAAFNVQPKAYDEAALVDGANQWHIMTRVSMPLCMGEFGTVLLINFITYWNDYQTPFLYMPDKPTLAFNTWSLTFREVSEADLSFPPVVITSAVMLLLPVLVLFLIFQKKLLTNVDIGGIKG